MKRIELTFTALLLPIDIVAVIVALAVANHLRSTIDLVPFSDAQSTTISYYFLTWYIGILVLFFAYHRLYILKETNRLARVPFKVLSATASASMLHFMVVMIGRTPLIDRSYPEWHAWSNNVSLLTVLYFWIGTVVFVTIGRVVYRILLRILFSQGLGRRRILLVGKGATAEKLLQLLERDRGIEIVHIKELQDAEDAIATYSPDEILLAEPDMPYEKVLPLIDLAYESHVEFSFAPNLFEVLASNVRVSEIGQVPLLELRRTPLDGWGRIIKRGMDILISLVLLVIFTPLCLLVMALVKLQDGGPVLFGQERVSPEGLFTMYKFRSMILNAEEMDDHLRSTANERGDGPLFKMRNDPRITKLGRFLRQTRIDELPQLFNVLKGEMSLVGPRPHLKKEVSQYQKHHRKVLAIKPGLTGFAQLAGNSDLPFEDEIRLDTYYIENWSLLKDLEILIKTPYIVLFKDRSGC